MNAATHPRAQLRALLDLKGHKNAMQPNERADLERWHLLCGARHDTRHLGPDSLARMRAMCEKYL